MASMPLQAALGILELALRLGQPRCRRDERCQGLLRGPDVLGQGDHRSIPGLQRRVGRFEPGEASLQLLLRGRRCSCVHISGGDERGRRRA
eukprot:8505122-Lingulodinium_polyedra.AAC.1